MFAQVTDITPEEYRRITVGILLANKVMPGLIDRYLARTGYQSQQSDQPRDPHQRGNL